MRSRLRGLMVAVALVVGLGSCSGQPQSQPAAAPPPSEGAHNSASGSAGGHNHGSTPGSVELWAVQSKPLGVVVTDGRGRIVYRHDGDTNQPPTTTCVDAACTANWEPVVVGDGSVVPLGIDEEKIGTFVRPNGEKQVTLAGWPLYVHVGDPNGLKDAGAQGADGTWFAIAPDGEKSTPPA